MSRDPVRVHVGLAEVAAVLGQSEADAAKRLEAGCCRVLHTFGAPTVDRDLVDPFLARLGLRLPRSSAPPASGVRDTAAAPPPPAPPPAPPVQLPDVAAARAPLVPPVLRGVDVSAVSVAGRLQLARWGRL